MDVMDDLAEIGYDMMHPIQESAGMDPATVKEKYGDKFVLYGSLDVVDGLLAYQGDVLDEYITAVSRSTRPAAASSSTPAISSSRISTPNGCCMLMPW